MVVDLPRAVLVDIDGTLALRGDHDGARHFAEWARVGEDQPNPPIVELVHTLFWAGRHRIILMSGRDEVCRWQIVKRELFERHILGRYEVAFVVDDRAQVVRMWRDELGLTVLQCADGDF